MAKRILLVGKPNVGKSSLFNLLTGIRQKVGNYSGVTVEKKQGTFKAQQIFDLPGLSSLWAGSTDERISIQELLKADPQDHRILFVADGMSLEQDLVLFSQIADLQLPSLLLINFSDELDKKQIKIDTNQLAKRLGCPALLFSTKEKDQLGTIEKKILDDHFKIPNAFLRSSYEQANQETHFVNHFAQEIADYRQSNEQKSLKAMEDLEKRRQTVHAFYTSIAPPPASNSLWTDRADRILLHPIWGTLLFIFTLLVIFQAVFSFSAIPMDAIDGWFGDASAWASANIQPSWLAEIIGDALLPGLGGIVIFVPQIVILFFLLGVLESTGYMARIAYLSDRGLRHFGLSGSSVIPLLSGIACAIPAVMSARSIDDERERLAAILVTPFMTCSARLPVYTLLIGLMVPQDAFLWIFNVKGLMLLGLYLLGTLTALLAAWLFSKWKKSDSSLWVLELPRYQKPQWSNVFITSYNKTKAFVLGAGKFILFFSILLWLLASFSPHSEATFQEKFAAQPDLSESSIRLEYSYAGYLGKTIEPVIRPLGYDWKIGIALLTSFAAREVFVGTISTVYSIGSEEEMTIIQRLEQERNPETGKKRYDWATCISLLLFYAFAMQCMSTLAIVKQETGTWKWPMVQLIGMLLLAYFSALLVYQLMA